MAREEHERYSPRYLTSAEVIAYYQEHDQPLDETVILTVLAPLAGTSFLPMVHQALHERLHNKGIAVPPDNTVSTRDLNLALYGRDVHDDFVDVGLPALKEQALAALHTFTPYPVTVHAVLQYKPLQADEMFLIEERFDTVFADEAHTTTEFTHLAQQWRFYTGGSLIHVVPMSIISYEQGETGTYQANYLLSEGYHDYRFYDDPNRIALPFIDPAFQAYERTMRFLAISSAFSYDAARRK